MAKTAKFDRDEVIQKATNLYWEKGFHGTSMRNLQDVIDMRPGSIYAAFGSKENLFKESIQHYANNGRNYLIQCRAHADSPLEALKAFIKRAVLDSQQTAPSGMCMLVKAIAELTEEQEELLIEAKHLLAKMESEFAITLQAAIDKGELDSSKDPAQLAKYVQIQIMGLRTYARTTGNITYVEQQIESMFSCELKS
ncbi:TetR/AcrR family transcriptional regulator [Photobacterium sanctipauli]|uniref:TetR/AcrR family transcriptional regulator n=1 Tax=Photobacterium sanctipauli TaxID=1342794 RepID=A0A2T3P0Q5_9GAMM|nr:TetR/AcrR family transcriptional regulator [Photobacterium sanctipauli]PSW22090.1 TetR/AcrR family transcriptional regulator [Photobacterium sanctipauli]